eukprot:scaffold27323_cov124-Isochrysis_galbana.AAC.2
MCASKTKQREHLASTSTRGLAACGSGSRQSFIFCNFYIIRIRKVVVRRVPICVKCEMRDSCEIASCEESAVATAIGS